MYAATPEGVRTTCGDCKGTGWITVRTGVNDADQVPCDCVVFVKLTETSPNVYE